LLLLLLLLLHCFRTLRLDFLTLSHILNVYVTVPLLLLLLLQLAELLHEILLLLQDPHQHFALGSFG
jgi:hypothetical protein